MRKYGIILCFATALLMIFTIAVSAVTPYYSDTGDENELAEIKALVENDNIFLTETDKATIDFNSSYKYYSLNTPYFADNLSDGKTLLPLLSDNSQWAVPYLSNSVICFLKVDGKWQINGTSSPSAEASDIDYSANIINTEKVAELVNTQLEGKEITKLIYITAPEYMMSAALIVTGTQEYIIPYSTRPDFAKLENGKLYTVTAAAEILSTSMPQPLSGTDENGAQLYGASALSTGNSVGTETSISQPSVFVITAVSLCIVFTAVIALLTLLISKKKRIHK